MRTTTKKASSFALILRRRANGDYATRSRQPALCGRIARLLYEPEGPMPAFIKVTVRATSLESYNVAVERISWATTVYWEGRYGSPLWQTGAFMFIYAEKFITRMLNLKPYEKRYIEVTVKAARRPVWAKG